MPETRNYTIKKIRNGKAWTYIKTITSEEFKIKRAKINQMF